MSAATEAALILEQHAGEIADAAASELLKSEPNIRQRFGETAINTWTKHLEQRTLELCAALAAEQSGLFVSRVNWSRAAMSARNIEASELEASLSALGKILQPYLDPPALKSARGYIDAAVQTLRVAEQGLEQSALDPGVMTGRVAQRYIQSVIAGNAIPGMSIVLDAVDEGLNARDAILKVLLPAQQEVGRLWHMNEISVAEEHMVTMTTQRLMAVLANKVKRASANGHTAIAATVAGNIHEVGIRAIAYLLEFNGWRTIYLGPDVPKGDIPAAVQCFDGDVILLSLALSSQLPELRRTIAHIREENGSNIKIIVGGNGLNGAPDIWRELGADAYGQTAEAALTAADELVASVKQRG